MCDVCCMWELWWVGERARAREGKSEQEAEWDGTLLSFEIGGGPRGREGRREGTGKERQRTDWRLQERKTDGGGERRDGRRARENEDSRGSKDRNRTDGRARAGWQARGEKGPRSENEGTSLHHCGQRFKMTIGLVSDG